jgi:1-deoxy-D-xylulose-5-phosphate synthase
MSNKLYPLLQSINDPADLRRLPREQLATLSTELLSYVIDSVSKTVGQLRSNLGTVELTVALHYNQHAP